MSETVVKNSSKNTGAASGSETQSRLSSLIFSLLGVWLVFSVIAFGAVDAWALGVSSVFAGLVSVLWAADAFLNREFRYNSTPLQIPLLALISLGTIQLLPLRRPDFADNSLAVSAVNSLSLAPYSTRLALIQLFVYFVFFAAALSFINSDKRLKKIVLTIIIFGAAMAFYGILQGFVDGERIYGARLPAGANPFASFVNRHHFAAFMEMTVGIALGLLFGKATKSNKRIFLIIAVVIMGMALIFTASRGGMISLFGVTAFVVAANLLKKPAAESNQEIAEKQNYRRNYALVGSAIALILVLFGAVLLLGGDQSLIRGTGLANAEDISNGRFHFWQIGWQIFLSYPILGAGLDAFGTAFTRFDSWNGTFRVEQAHNDYLQVLAEAGICGLVCVAAFIYLLFKQSAAVISESKDKFRRGAAIGALAGCFGVLIHSFFDFPLRTPSNALFFLTLSAIATVSIAAPKSSRKNRLKSAI